MITQVKLYYLSHLGLFKTLHFFILTLPRYLFLLSLSAVAKMCLGAILTANFEFIITMQFVF